MSFLAGYMHGGEGVRVPLDARRSLADTAAGTQVAAIQHLALAEAAQAAAWSEYESVAQRNDAEIAATAAVQVHGVTTRVSDWVGAVAASAEAEAAAWVRVARNLGGDPAVIAHLEQM